MKKTTKIAVGVLIGIGVLAIALIIVNTLLEKKLRTGIEDNLKKAHITFDKVDVKLLDRTAEVINPFAKISGKTLRVDTIQLNDIQIWDYLLDKDIIVGELEISGPEVNFYNFKDKAKDTSSVDKKKKQAKFKNKVLVKKVNVHNGSFKIFEKDSSAHRLFAKVRAIKMEQVRINEKTLKETIPFNYELILLNADSLFYDLNEQQELSLGDFEIDNHKVTISNFRIIPKYSKSEHQKTISVEKDRYDLTIDSIFMENLNWSVQEDSLKIENPLTRIVNADFRIYRDKYPPDDTSIKPMYSEMIRKIPFLINFDSISISNSYLKYEERVHVDRVPGVVEFSNLNMQIKNFMNVGLDRKDFPKTKVISNSSFMNGAPLHVDWEFDVSDRADQFQISGDMGRLAAEQMNKFMKAGLNIEASGEILSMYFNFYGNKNKAQGEMRLEYKDFKVEVLRKDGNKKNKVISALANLIVRNKAQNNKAHYKNINFTRVKTKSFWNYVWNLLKNGALKSFL